MKTYKFKLHNAKRNRKLHRQINIAGAIYNHCIAVHRRYYRLFKKSFTAFSLSKHLAKLKKLPKYAHWKLVGSQAIQDISERIGRAYTLFFRNLKHNVKTNPPSFTYRPRPICSAQGTKNPLPLGMGSVKFRQGLTKEI